MNWIKNHLYLTLFLAWLVFFTVTGLLMSLCHNARNSFVFFIPFIWVILGVIALISLFLWAVGQKSFGQEESGSIPPLLIALKQLAKFGALAIVGLGSLGMFFMFVVYIFGD